MNRPKSLQPYIKMCATIGAIPSSYLVSMTYEEQLIWLCNFLEKEVIPVVNNNSEVVKELLNWFENLDVQEEVDNKIEEMYESGQLQEIITEYLQINGVLGFNTVADMKAGTNFIDGSICKTLGTLTYNDGKGNYYKIRTLTAGDTIDEINIIALTNFDTLIAELIPNYYISSIEDEITNINGDIEDINGDIDDINEDITSINNAIDNINDFIGYDAIVATDGTGDYTSLATAVSTVASGSTIYVKAGTYNNEVVNAIGKNLTIIGEDRDKVIIQNNLDIRNQAPISMTKGYVANISFKSLGNITNNDHAYAAHLDDNDSYNNNLTFENCYFSSVSNSAVGIGLRPNSNLKFVDCEFYTQFSPSGTNKGCFFIHNSADSNYYGDNQYCYLENCKIYSQYSGCIHLESCGPNTNKGYLVIQNCNLFSELYKNGNDTNPLITSDIYVTATDKNMIISAKSGGNGNPIANYSLFNTTTPQVIDKFINDQETYPIYRKIYSYPITAGTELHLTLPTNYRETINLYGKVVNSNFTFPLNMYLAADAYCNGFIDEGVGRINVNSTISGTCLVILEYSA